MLSPLWISAGIGLSILLIIGIVALIVFAFKRKPKPNRARW